MKEVCFKQNLWVIYSELGSIKIHRLVVGVFQANCYILVCEDSGEAVVIDPGGSRHRILSNINKAGATLRYIIITHGHIDHGAGAPFLQKKTGAEVLAHPGDVRRASLLGLIWLRLKIREVAEGDEIPFCSGSMRVIHTPGHSPGSICILYQDTLFTGDLLFAGGVGRWDLPRGDFKTLAKSLREGIKHLPDSLRVLPGHGPETTLGYERQTNPFFKPEFNGMY
jgi:hydroxyacylglutathione hydrolase